MALQLPEKALLQIVGIDFDIIHGHPSGGGITFLGLETARFKNIPYVVTYHTFLNRYTHYVLYGKVINPKMVDFLTKLVGNLLDYIIAQTIIDKCSSFCEWITSYSLRKRIFTLI